MKSMIKLTTAKAIAPPIRQLIRIPMFTISSVFTYSLSSVSAVSECKDISNHKYFQIMRLH